MLHKNLWMCWFQGLNHERMPELNRRCISRWSELNEPEWKVTVITRDNLPEHAPAFADAVKGRHLSLAKQSDVLRLLLLEKHGGVWADASVYPMQPLSAFIDSLVNETRFFAYRLPRRKPSSRGDREICSWFLVVDQVGHPVIRKWRKRFLARIRRREHRQYFCLHDSFAKLMDGDVQVAKCIREMVQISSVLPHSACPKSKNTLESFVYKRPAISRVETESDEPQSLG